MTQAVQREYLMLAISITLNRLQYFRCTLCFSSVDLCSEIQMTTFTRPSRLSLIFAKNRLSYRRKMHSKFLSIYVLIFVVVKFRIHALGDESFMAVRLVLAQHAWLRGAGPLPAAAAPASIHCKHRSHVTPATLPGPPCCTSHLEP